MALEYYNHIDLNKNQLQNAVIHPLGDAPSSASEGQIYYDSTVGDKQVYVYNGSAWIALGGNKFDKIAVTGQDNIVADGTNDTLTFAGGSNVTITTNAGTDTITIAATDTNTQLTTEEVQDIVGAMVTGNTESNISVTYQDSDGTLDFASTDTNTQLTTEEVQDIIGGMVSSNTETNISVTYDDTNGKLDFASTDTNTQRGAGTGLTLNGNNLDVSASQTSVSSLKNTSLVIGRDADNDIDFATDNAIIFRANGADQIKLVDGVIEPITNSDIDLGTTSKKFKNAYASKYYGSDHQHYLDPDGPASYIKTALRLTTGSGRIGSNISSDIGAAIEIKSGTGGFSPGTNAVGGSAGVLYFGLQGRVVRSSVTYPTNSFMILKNTDSQTGNHSTSHASKVFWALGRNNTMGSPVWASGQGTPRFMLHMTGDGHLKTGAWNGSSYQAGTGALTVNHNLVVNGSTTLGDSTSDTVTVSGNLIVNGTTTTVNSNTVNIGDNIIVLNSDETGTPSQDGGIEIERGTSTNVKLLFDEGTDRWQFTNDGSTYYNIPTTGDITDTNTQNTYSVSIPSSSTKLRLTGAGHDGATTDDIEFVGSGATTVTRTSDSKFTISSTDTNTNTQLSTEQVQDIVGGMVSSNTETNIAVTYDDTNGKLDFSATDTNTNTQLATAAALIDVSDGSFNTTAAFTHGLTSKNLIVQLYDVTTGEVIFADIDHTSNNAISIVFATKPTNDIRVVVIDAKNGLSDKTVSYS